MAALSSKRLDDRIKRVRRLVLDAFSKKHGDKPYRLMEPRHMRRLRDEKADRPEARIRW
ncbi:hypothetical protein [Chelatococcus asaccharovorans]|uniref:hypothetical protein n=1 Tax=Chelatococcus asaccharovorans TaxID=28210 RepID=UPI001AECE8F2|nr:hypothetical protein [Chelatococcus asaccharovorans]